MSSPKSNHCLFVTLRGEIRDPTGRILKTLPETPANSFVRQFIELLYRHVAVIAYSVTKPDGGENNTDEGASTFRCNSGLGDTTWGIWIGDDDTAVDITDYTLGNQLTTNIVYGAHNIAAPITNAGKCYIDIIRVFTNNTGAAINIKEVGLIVCGEAIASPHLIDRSLYSAVVENGGSISLRYRISVAV